MKQALSLTSGTVFNYAHNIDGDYWQRDKKAKNSSRYTEFYGRSFQ